MPVVLITGGRKYADYKVVQASLDPLLVHSDLILVQGGASGADRMAKDWATRAHVHCATVPALWDASGPGAGGKRNSAMLLLKPDFCIAFPGKRGTADMVAKCRAAGIPVYFGGQSGTPN